MKKRPIIVCGLNHVSDKIARHYQILSELSKRKVFIYSDDVTGNSMEISKKYSNIRFLKIPRNKKENLTKFWYLLTKNNPAHVEIYFSSKSSLVHLGYLILVKLLRLPLVSFCRGGELLYWDNHSYRVRFIYWLTLKLSKLILYKQLHMPTKLKELNISERKTHFFYNRVPYNSSPPKPVEERMGVLYLNSWRKFRRPDIAVNVGIKLAKKYPGVRFTVAGERYWAKEYYSRARFQELINSAGLEGRVNLVSWVDNPENLFNSHSIFLLPSELVFLNYSLLEAMERGLVPVVSDAEGANNVITHGEDGLIVKLNTGSFIEAVDYLLSNIDKLRTMSAKAREKVKEKFNLHTGMEELISIYKNKVWK